MVIIQAKKVRWAMQTAKKIQHHITAEIIPFDTFLQGTDRKKILNNNVGEKPCFRTSARYTCRDRNCSSWNECKKLVAEWMR